jgi:Family of unknown function (DUF5989)
VEAVGAAGDPGRDARGDGAGEERMKAMLRSMASNFSVVGELLGFLWKRKLWWLIPMVAVLLLFGLLLIFASTSGIGPFIYTLF